MKYLEEDQQIWFENKNWLQEWQVQPHSSINKKLLYFNYLQNADRWIRAFTFLKNTDLNSLRLGTHYLDGTDVFVKVEEYLTKNEEETQYEAHRLYADIQYLVSGAERIGIAPLSSTTVLLPYDQAEDLGLYSAADDSYHVASPNHFFIFFPEDAHRPCVKVNESSAVKKIVVKIKLNGWI